MADIVFLLDSSNSFVISQTDFRAGSQESTSCVFETPKSTGPNRVCHTKGAQNPGIAPASAPGPFKRIFPNSLALATIGFAENAPTIKADQPSFLM
jgi:hypothetical protein